MRISDWSSDVCSADLNEEALALYDIARERGCRLIVISSGGRLSEKAREDEVILYPAEAGLVSQPGASSVSQSSSISNPGASSVSGPESSAVLTSGMALGYALGYQFQIIFELLGVYKKPDLIKIADTLDNASEDRKSTRLN